MKRSVYLFSAFVASLVLLLVLLLTLLLTGYRFRTIHADGYGTLHVFGTAEKGTVYYEKGRATYYGKDRLVFENGDVYVGAIQNYLPNGQGVLTTAGGEICEANFVNGKAEGYGRYIFADGDFYEGLFSQGEMSGEGTLVFVRDSEESRLTAVFEKGHLTKDVSYSYKNGTNYTGGYSGGVPSGSGRIAFANGDVYEGTLENGLVSGYGTYTYSDGSIYQGRFENGRPNGTGVYTYEENGMTKTLAGSFYNGVFLKDDETEE